jgi:hypothetical protein
MDALLLIVALGAGLICLFLVAELIAADFATWRAERIAARPPETLGEQGRRQKPRS